MSAKRPRRGHARQAQKSSPWRQPSRQRRFRRHAVTIVFVYGVVPVAPWTTAFTLLACVAIFTCLGAWIGALLKRTLAAVPLCYSGLAMPFHRRQALRPTRFDAATIWRITHLSPVYYAVGVLGWAFHGLGVTPEPIYVNLLVLLAIAIASAALTLQEPPGDRPRLGVGPQRSPSGCAQPAAIAASLLPALGMGVWLRCSRTRSASSRSPSILHGHGRFAPTHGRDHPGGPRRVSPGKMTSADAERALGEQRPPRSSSFGELRLRLSAAGTRRWTSISTTSTSISPTISAGRDALGGEFDAPQLGLLGELHGAARGVLLPNPIGLPSPSTTCATPLSHFLQYRVIPIVVLIIISIGLLGTALLTASDFERGTAKMLVLSPEAVCRSWSAG